VTLQSALVVFDFELGVNGIVVGRRFARRPISGGGCISGA
jgi:hypothetical protein